jgi:hypothetical protein
VEVELLMFAIPCVVGVVTAVTGQGALAFSFLLWAAARVSPRLHMICRQLCRGKERR